MVDENQIRKGVEALLYAVASTSGVVISLQAVTQVVQLVAAVCAAVLGVVGVVRLFVKTKG